MVSQYIKNMKTLKKYKFSFLILLISIFLIIVAYFCLTPQVYAYQGNTEIEGYTWNNGKISYPQVNFRRKGKEYNQKLNAALKEYTVGWLGMLEEYFGSIEFPTMDISMGLYCFNERYLCVEYTIFWPGARSNFDKVDGFYYVVNLDTCELVLLDDLIEINEDTAALFVENMKPAEFPLISFSFEEAYEENDRRIKNYFTEEIMLRELIEDSLTFEEFIEKDEWKFFQKNTFHLAEEGICLADYGEYYGYDVSVLIPYDVVEQVIINEDFRECLREKNTCMEIEYKD